MFMHFPIKCTILLAYFCTIIDNNSINHGQYAESDKTIMTVKEVAENLKINESTAYRLASNKKLPGFKVGGSYHFKTGVIEAWISYQSNQLARS